ncbi:MAG: prepilin-type N-terminal cleavage/methylation domain-containing protein [Candidatus Eisenbacteria bacterium]|nr:prepilin-type N-terminal cleavage/methylation domain-containing protein [Candidatus Eisenbacteria bacterium]
MDDPNRHERGVTFIEVVVVLVIVLIIASLVLRVVFARQLQSWEDGVWRSLGIEPGLGRIAGALVALAYLVFRWVWQGRRRKRRR